MVERIKELKSQGASLNGIRTNLFREEEDVVPHPGTLEDFVERLVKVIRTEIYDFLEESLRESDRLASGMVPHPDGTRMMVFRNCEAGLLGIEEPR